MAGPRLVLAGVALPLLAFAAGAGAASGPRVKNTNGWIGAIAMDGPRVAYDVEPQAGGCNRLFVWNVLTEGGALVSGRGTCDANSTSTGGGVVRVAVAGTRVAWIVNLGGNTESSDDLYTASLPRPREKRLASALRTGDVDCALAGRSIGGLVGDGDLLAYNTWTSAAASPGDPSSCAVAPTAGSLRRIGGSSTAELAGGTGTLVAQAADLGRIAVLHEDGTVALYSASGLLLQEIEPSSAREVALRKDFLVVLTQAKTLEIYNANTGALVKTRPVPGGAARLDVHSGIAVYVVGRSVHALRLTTGKDVVVARAPRAVLDVEIEAAGAVYAFNTVRGGKDVGNVAFLPLARVAAAVS